MIIEIRSQQNSQNRYDHRREIEVDEWQKNTKSHIRNRNAAKVNLFAIEHRRVSFIAEPKVKIQSQKNESKSEKILKRQKIRKIKIETIQK